MNDALYRIEQGKLVGILRSENAEALTQAIECIYEGGIDCIEVTMTVPGALEIIADVRKRFGPKICLGAGTILDSTTARLAILAGAEYLVAPHTDQESILMARRYGVPLVPGTLTPTEMMTAISYGAEVVKLFPSDCFGVDYIKAILRPLPQVKMMPTGGVDAGNLRQYLDAGVVAVGLGSSLISGKELADGKVDEVSSRAAELCEIVKQWKDDTCKSNG